MDADSRLSWLCLRYIDIPVGRHGAVTGNAHEHLKTVRCLRLQNEMVRGHHAMAICNLAAHSGTHKEYWRRSADFGVRSAPAPRF